MVPVRWQPCLGWGWDHGSCNAQAVRCGLHVGVRGQLELGTMCAVEVFSVRLL